MEDDLGERRSDRQSSYYTAHVAFMIVGDYTSEARSYCNLLQVLIWSNASSNNNAKTQGEIHLRRSQLLQAPIAVTWRLKRRDSREDSGAVGTTVWVALARHNLAPQ